MTRDQITVGEISRMLSRSAQAVARALCPDGSLGGKYWEVGSGKGKSLKILISGPDAGKWRDYVQEGLGGDLIDLAQHRLGLDKAGAVQWAKQYLGLSDDRGDRRPAISEAERKRRLAEQERLEAEDRERAEKDRALRQAKAIDLWKAGDVAIGTPVERYLKARGIAGPPPKTLRYLRRCWHVDSASWLPAMVAAVQAADVYREGSDKKFGPIIGVHRTYLDPTKPEKAKVDKPKMMLGDVQGGCVRLTAAASTMILCEGIETGLSLRLTSTAAVWCGLSVGGMVAAWIPDDVSELILAVDGDRVGSAAWFAARERAVERHRRPGRNIKILEPPTGLDFNDLAQRRAGAAR